MNHIPFTYWNKIITPTPTPTPTPTVTVTPTVTPTPGPTLVLWWKVENINSSGFQNTIFDTYVTWEYSGLTGQSSTYTTTRNVSTSPVTYNLTNSFVTDSFLYNATNVTFRVYRRLCGNRSGGQTLNSVIIYLIQSNNTSLPPTFGQNQNYTMSSPGCIKTCYTIYNELTDFMAQPGGGFTPVNITNPYVHIMIEDKISNSSC